MKDNVSVGLVVSVLVLVKMKMLVLMMVLIFRKVRLRGLRIFFRFVLLWFVWIM